MKLLGNIIIALGGLVLVFGIISTPLVQDLLPLTIPDGGDSHTYYRVVSDGPAPPFYIPLAVIGCGVLFVAIGFLVRRRHAA